ncbi:MAG: RluA family pseudouridine synthase [Pseudomonadota bacterium]
MRIVAEKEGRADAIVAGAVEALSRTRAQSLIRAGAVELNGVPLNDPSKRLAPGDILNVTVPPPEPARPRPQKLPLDVLYEDDAVIVLNKPAGLVVHPAAGHAEGTLVNALLAHCGDSLSGIGGVLRPGIVHRLDKDTSGVMVVAKSDSAHQSLSAQFADHGRTGPLRRRYDALIWGVVRPPKGTIQKPIGRHRHDRQRFAVVENGKTAITHYVTHELFTEVSRVRCTLETGRTHQIRVHMAAMGHPLLGDPLYGAGFASKANRLGAPAKAALSSLGRQALHASDLAFAHPSSGTLMQFTAELPQDFSCLIKALVNETELRTN